MGTWLWLLGRRLPRQFLPHAGAHASLGTPKTIRIHPLGNTRSSQHLPLWAHGPWPPQKHGMELAPCTASGAQASIWPCGASPMASSTHSTIRGRILGTMGAKKHPLLCLWHPQWPQEHGMALAPCVPPSGARRAFGHCTHHTWWWVHPKTRGYPH